MRQGTIFVFAFFMAFVSLVRAQIFFCSGFARGAFATWRESERVVRAGLRSQGIHERTLRKLDDFCRHRADQVGGV